MSWRLLAADPDAIAFNIYRSLDGGPPVLLNQSPLTEATHFLDPRTNIDAVASYFVRPVLSAIEQPASTAATVPARPYLSIPLRTLPGYSPNDASVGDLDGDGEYEIVLHQAGRGRDNSQAGQTEPPLLEAYKLDGTFLWRINLGRNIREGAHYTQFLVYDFDGDGRAEVACKTADGTIDGRGHVLGDATADWRTKSGRAEGKILDGPEYLTLFDGRTGAALVTTNYVPARGNPSDWGDTYGNRVDRFLACVAYLDGRRPSLVMCRGYYTRTVLAAWDWREGRLTQRWVFDTHDGTPGHRAYTGQGNHNLSVGDVDGDGRDEILYGAMCVDDDGKGLWNTGLGHGDALHFSDLDPDRPGLEIFDIHEHVPHAHGIAWSRSCRIRSIASAWRGKTSATTSRPTPAFFWAKE